MPPARKRSSLNPPVQTIEATGKGLKLQMAIGVMMILFGAVWALIGGETRAVGGWMFSLGLIFYIVTRIRIWWKHG